MENPFRSRLCGLWPLTGNARQLVEHARTQTEARIAESSWPTREYGLSVSLKTLRKQFEGTTLCLLRFGRDLDTDSECDISWPSSYEWSKRHCSIDFNISSGELLLTALGSRRDFGLGDQYMHMTSTRAMVYNHTKILNLGNDIKFDIRWSPVPKSLLDDYRKAKIDMALSYLPDCETLSQHTTREPEHARRWQDTRSLRSKTQAGYKVPPSQATDTDEDSSFAPIRVKRLGQGSFGSVYLAVDRFTADLCAVKEICYDSQTPLLQQRLQWLREVAIGFEISESKQNHVAKMYDWRDNGDEGIEIDLDFYEAGDLRKHMSLARARTSSQSCANYAAPWNSCRSNRSFTGISNLRTSSLSKMTTNSSST